MAPDQKPAAPSGARDDPRVAVVTGGHRFDVQGFHRLFRSLPGVDPYIQHMDDFASSSPEVRRSYDAIVFYTMMLPTPREGAGEWFNGNPREAVLALKETGQGILLLHHSLVAYREWDDWKALTGLPEPMISYHFGEKVRVEVADPDHPITRGLEPWEMTDETYLMKDTGEGSHMLFSTGNTRSMQHLGWTREFGRARVFCFQSGHDAGAWDAPGFREALRRGILWCSRRL
jgi:type 1 glutamine amidotransferase